MGHRSCFVTLGISGAVFARTRILLETHYHAYYDFLTGLPNRLLLEDRFKQAIANSRRTKTNAALLFLDLDYFKIINDKLGHEAGDLVLRTVANRLLTHLREGDTLARIGGDEFVILLLNITKVEDIAIVAQKIIDTATKPITVYGEEVQVGSSIGVAIFPQHGVDYDTLSRNADDAMYVAKQLGRNNYQFFVTTEDQIVRSNDNGDV